MRWDSYQIWLAAERKTAAKNVVSRPKAGVFAESVPFLGYKPRSLFPVVFVV